MFTGLFDYLNEAIGALLDLVIGWFMGALDLSLADMIASFPFLVSAYKVFQAVGLGLTIVIAAIGLYKFFFVGSIEGSSQDRPLTIILWTGIAVLMMYYGGYVLEEMVKIAKIPYDVFRDLDSVQLGLTSDSDSGYGTYSGLVTGVIALFTALTPVGLSVIAIAAVGNFILLVAIAWELIKLTLEVCERYMMVGILVYTSPLAYSTLASSSTRQIFKKWLSMFVSSLLLMSFSVFFLKLANSGFSYVGKCLIGDGIASETGTAAVDGHIMIIRLFLILSITKIAQRVDSYLNTLGLSAAQGGSDLLGALIAGKDLIGRYGIGGGKGGAVGGILGKMTGQAMKPNSPVLNSFSKMQSGSNRASNQNLISRMFNPKNSAVVQAYQNAKRNASAGQNGNIAQTLASTAKGLGAAAATLTGTMIPPVGSAINAKRLEDAADQQQMQKDTNLPEKTIANPGKIPENTGLYVQDGEIVPDGFSKENGVQIIEGDDSSAIRTTGGNAYMFNPEGKHDAIDQQVATGIFNRENMVENFKGNTEAIDIVDNASANYAKSLRSAANNEDRDIAQSARKEAQHIVNYEGVSTSSGGAATYAFDAAYGDSINKIAEEQGVSLKEVPSAVQFNNHTETDQNGNSLYYKDQSAVYQDEKTGKYMTAQVVSGATLHSDQFSESERKQFKEIKLQDGNTMYARVKEWTPPEASAVAQMSNADAAEYLQGVHVYDSDSSMCNVADKAYGEFVQKEARTNGFDKWVPSAPERVETKDGIVHMTYKDARASIYNQEQFDSFDAQSQNRMTRYEINGKNVYIEFGPRVSSDKMNKYSSERSLIPEPPKRGKKRPPKA